MTGTLFLDPHGPGPAVRFPARPSVRALLAGRTADAAATLLPALFTLCGHAHRVAARLVVDGARGRDASITRPERDALAGEALREHVRCVLLDWPQQVPVADASQLAQRDAALVACPLFRGAADYAAVMAWTATHVFGRPPAAWLSLLGDDAALDAWCAEGRTFPARWLAAVLDDACRCGGAPLVALRIDAPPSDAWRRDLCDWMLAPAPTVWPGAAHESGRWIGASPARHAADRLVARLRAIAGLVLGSDAPPRAVTWSPRPDCALTMVEIARGVLLHAARLDADGATLADYGVMAPTDWNFAPHGPVARALHAVAREPQAAQREQRARIVGAAFSPCLPFDVATTHQEPACMS